MRTMEDAHLAERDNRHATALALADLGPEFDEERLNVLLLKVGARRVGKDDIKRALVLPLHDTNGTINKYY